MSLFNNMSRRTALGVTGAAMGMLIAPQLRAQEKTVRWALHPGEEADAVIKYFAPKYKQMTGVNIIGEILPPNQLRDRMSIEAIGKTGRWDLGYHSPGWFGTFAKHVVDLTPLIKKHGFDVSAYPKLVVDSHMRSEARPGEIIALPTTPAAPMLIARRDFFEHPEEKAAFKAKYGRDLAVPKTIGELKQVADFFTRKGGEKVAGQTLSQPLFGWADALGSGAGITRSFIVFLYSAGLRGWDQAYKTDLNEPLLNQVAETFVKLAKENAPREAQNWGFLEGLQYFRDGRLAMATMWPQGLSTVEDKAGRSAGKVLYQPLPVWEGNKAGFTQGTPFLGGGGVMVFDTPNAEEGFKFLKWMLQDEEIEWARQSNQFSRAKHFSDPALRNAQPYYKDFLPAYEKTLQSVFIRQGIPEYGAVMWQGTTDYITEVFSGAMTPQQAQQRWVRMLNTSFQRAGYLK